MTDLLTEARRALELSRMAIYYRDPENMDNLDREALKSVEAVLAKLDAAIKERV